MMSGEEEYMKFSEGKNRLSFMISEFGDVLVIAHLENDVCLFNTGLNANEFCKRLQEENDKSMDWRNNDRS